MVRFLLTVFILGFAVAAGSWATVMALGGPQDGWLSIRDDHGHWDFGDDDDNGGPPSKGVTISRDLAWTPGDSLDINVPAKITYTQGPVAKITATGMDRLVNNIEVQDDKIDLIHRHRGLRHAEGLVLTITAPSVRRFELNGAAYMTIASYDQDNLSLKLNGASKVDVAGKAKDLSLRMNGASQSDLSHLVNETADVEMNGAGQATLATTGHADIEINGVGNARLINTPSVSRRIHGLGSIETGSGPEADDGDKIATPPAAAKPAPAAPATKAPRAKAEPA